jgi:hypothetical protein
VAKGLKRLKSGVLEGGDKVMDPAMNEIPATQDGDMVNMDPSMDEIPAPQDGDTVYMDPSMDEIPATQEDLFGEEPDEKTTVMVPEYASMPVKPMVTSSDGPQPPPEDGPTELAESEGENEKDRKKELHRASSRAWHAKWISKGVPREAVPPATALVATAPAADSPELASPSPSVSSSLARARDKFISEWIELSDMPKSQERFKAACKAWMESTIRADFLSARAGVQR